MVIQHCFWVREHIMEQIKYEINSSDEKKWKKLEHEDENGSLEDIKD